MMALAPWPSDRGCDTFFHLYTDRGLFVSGGEDLYAARMDTPLLPCSSPFSCLTRVTSYTLTSNQRVHAIIRCPELRIDTIIGERRFHSVWSTVVTITVLLMAGLMLCVIDLRMV